MNAMTATDSKSASEKKILMVAYEFPPLAAGGVARSKVFSEHLPEYYWTPIVLTPKMPYGRVIGDAPVISNVEVVRTSGADVESVLKVFSRLAARLGFKGEQIPGWFEWRFRALWRPFCMPDNAAGWALWNIPKAISLALFRKVDVVYTTSWPYSDHLVGLALKTLTRKPWVADFRDPFIRHLNYGRPSARRDRLNRWLERKICERADLVVSPTDFATKQFQQDYPRLPDSKFVTIRNGFDEKEFTGVAQETNGLSILHSGAFYLSRRPDSFLEAIERFSQISPGFRDAVNVTFMGISQDEDLDISAYERYSFVTFQGWRPREESIRAIRRSKVLLLIRHPECSLTMPGKVYEYMASGNFIFAITGSSDELDVILKDYPLKIILRNPTVDEMVNALEEIYAIYVSGRMHVARPDYVAGYTRQVACRRLARFLDALIG